MAMLFFTFWSVNYLRGQCGFDDCFQPAYQENPEYFQQMEEDLQDMIDEMQNGLVMDPVLIPVVFHIIHQGEPEDIGGNIPNIQIQEAINSLNSDFIGTNIEFCLAKRDPQGNSLSEEGVQRVNGTSMGYSGIMTIGGNESDIKSYSYFTNFRYLNIWVVSGITSASSGNGEILGFATFPESTPSSIDGIVMDKDNMGFGDWHILTHEVGHFLNVYHTFEGDDPDYDGQNLDCPPLGAGEGDMCDDTQAHIRSSSGTCPSGNNGCYTSGIIPQLENISNNHMDYSDETCRKQFTDDQVERMQACLMKRRIGLTNSLGCLPACNPNFAVDYSQNPTGSILINNNVTFTVMDPIGNYNYEWTIDGGNVQNTSNSFTYFFSAPGAYKICLTAFDSNNSDCPNEVCGDVYVVTNEACSNEALPLCELILNGNFNQNTAVEKRTAFNGSKRDFDLVCNFVNKMNSPDLCIGDDGHVTIGMIAGGEQISTAFELGLINGLEYNLSFEYYIYGLQSNSIREINAFFTDGINPINGEIQNVTKILNPVSDIIDPNHDIVSASCAEFVPYKYSSTSFTYDQSQPYYLAFSAIRNTRSYFLIRNITLTQCCIPEPTITYTQTDQCTFDFVFDKGTDEGSMYWTIESGPSGTTETTTQSFIVGGDYEVCLHAQCEGNGVVECITVRSEGCEMIDCDGVVGVSHGPKCPDDESLIINFSLNLPQGYGPCGENLYITPDINFSDHFFNAATGQLMVSANVNDPNQIFTIVVCGPDGSQLCYTVGGISQGSNLCDECTDITIPVIATCNDTNGSDLNFSYTGSFSITPPTGATPCGSGSTSGGYSQGAPSVNNGTYTFPFIINTNNPNPFQSEVTVCFIVGTEKFCYNIRLKVENPCVPTECIDIENITTIKCDKIENGVAIFQNVGHVLFIQDIFRDGYVLCDGNEINLDNGTVTLEDNWTTTSQNGYVTITSLSIPCEEIAARGQTTMTMNFCNEDEDEICVDLTLTLECDGCPNTRIEGRNNISHNSTDFDIYPNPAHDFVTIFSNHDSPDQTFTLTDISGKILLHESLIKGYNTISTQHYSGGLYYIQIEHENVRENYKIIIVK